MSDVGQTLIEVMPTYARDIEAIVDRACERIARLRDGKDIGRPDIDSGIQKYASVIDDLMGCLKRLQELRPKFDSVEEARR